MYSVVVLQCDCHVVYTVVVYLPDKIKYGCNRGNCYCNHNIAYQDVASDVGKIKDHKFDVNYRLNLAHIVNGCHKLYVHMSVLFNTMLSHSGTASDMFMSALVSFPRIGRN